jgi:hypothetical protein
VCLLVDNGLCAGLLFLNFEGGGTLQLTGEARIIWDAGRAARFTGAERVVEIRVQEVLETEAPSRCAGGSRAIHRSTPRRVPQRG